MIMRHIFKNTIITGQQLFAVCAWACEACRLQQPKITRNITHGTGPESGWDWFIVGVVALIAVLAFAFSVKFLISPGEKNKSHIKYSVFSNQNETL